MSDFVILMAWALPLQFALFFLIYRFSRLQSKQVALVVIAISVAVFLPWGILTWQSVDQFAFRLMFLVTFPYLYGIVTSHWEAAKARGEIRDGKFFHWAPMTIFLFFVAIAVVDAIIISLADKGMSEEFAARFLPKPRQADNAVSYFPGNVAHDYQEKEALFNTRMAQLEKQKHLGWKIRKGWLEKPVTGVPAIFKVVIEGPDGQLIEGAEINGIFLRPGNHKLDRPFALSPDGNGAYLTTLTLPAPGRWNLAMTILRGEDRYELTAQTSVNDAPATIR